MTEKPRTLDIKVSKDGVSARHHYIELEPVLDLLDAFSNEIAPTVERARAGPIPPYVHRLAVLKARADDILREHGRLK